MIEILSLFVALFVVCISKAVYGSILAPVGLMGVAWATCFLLKALPVMPYQEVAPVIEFVYIAALVSFLFGGLLASLLVGGGRRFASEHKPLIVTGIQSQEQLVVLSRSALLCFTLAMVGAVSAGTRLRGVADRARCDGGSSSALGVRWKRSSLP